MGPFAAEHPIDVVDMILVDPTPTAFVEGECAIVNKALCDTLRKRRDSSANPEGLDFFRTVAEVLAAWPLPTVPFVALAVTNHHQPAISGPAIEQPIQTLWRSTGGAFMHRMDRGNRYLLPTPAVVEDS